MLLRSSGKSFLIVILILSCNSNSDSSINDYINTLANRLTRSEIILGADKFARIRWTMTEANIHANGCNPNGVNFVSQYPYGERIGMGYKWNGWEDIDSFMEKIQAGYGTGTGGYVNYEELGIPNECFTGVSCTGFVSKVWELDEKYTLNYPYATSQPQFREISDEISYNDLRKGDALINSEHIMLLAYKRRDGIITVFHSSGEGVRFEPIPWNYLNPRQTVPIRFRLIEEVENEMGSINNPIDINSVDFPYSHSGNTRDVVSLYFDKYSIIPSNNEVGPESIYLLSINNQRNINISINDLSNEGIDNNIYLLESLIKDSNQMAVDCLAWGDFEISTTLNSGTYYIVIDSGDNLPGEYTLIIN